MRLPRYFKPIRPVLGPVERMGSKSTGVFRIISSALTCPVPRGGSLPAAGHGCRDRTVQSGCSRRGTHPLTAHQRPTEPSQLFAKLAARRWFGTLRGHRWRKFRSPTASLAAISIGPRSRGRTPEATRHRRDAGAGQGRYFPGSGRRQDRREEAALAFPRHEGSRRGRCRCREDERLNPALRSLQRPMSRGCFCESAGVWLICGRSMREGQMSSALFSGDLPPPRYARFSRRLKGIFIDWTITLVVVFGA